MLQLTQTQTEQIQQAAIAQYPQECCGLLLGTLDRPLEVMAADQSHQQITEQQITHRQVTHRQVTQVWPTPNAWTPEIEAEHRAILGIEGIESMKGIDASANDPSQEHNRTDRFWIDPRDLLKAQKFARSQDWSVIGIYHSHPDYPAVPSERDRQSAWHAYSYLILSVSTTGIAEQRSWVLDDVSQFQPEKIEISP